MGAVISSLTSLQWWDSKPTYTKVILFMIVFFGGNPQTWGERRNTTHIVTRAEEWTWDPGALRRQCSVCAINKQINPSVYKNVWVTTTVHTNTIALVCHYWPVHTIIRTTRLCFCFFFFFSVIMSAFLPIVICLFLIHSARIWLRPFP